MLLLGVSEQGVVIDGAGAVVSLDAGAVKRDEQERVVRFVEVSEDGSVSVGKGPSAYRRHALILDPDDLLERMEEAADDDEGGSSSGCGLQVRWLGWTSTSTGAI